MSNPSSKPPQKIQSRRRSAIDVIIKGIELIETSKGKPYSVQLRKDLEELDDAAFDKFMADIRDGKNYIPFVAPGFKDHGVTLRNNFAVAEKLGVQFFQPVKYEDRSTGVMYWTKPALILDLPVKRQIQTREAGISVAGSKMSTDDMTDQVVGDSKASSVTSPESSGALARGTVNILAEFMGPRGGNLAANRTFEKDLMQTGRGSIHAAMRDGSRAKATDTFSVILKCMHFKNNL